MRFAVAVVIASAGCKTLLGIDDGVVADPMITDAMVDAAPDAQACFGPGEYAVCPRTVPTNDLSFDASTAIDTTFCLTGETNAKGWCVIAARTIVVRATLTISGARPLVLLASDTLTVGDAGVLDASSHTGGMAGPAASPGMCPTAGSGAQSTNGGSGGAGGTLGTQGGDGGAGSSGMTDPGTAVGPGMGAIGLRGGCRGGRGGLPNDPAGDGGGALYLVAGTSIGISGQVNASGAGGGAGKASKGGGSGGGSGGVIFLAAPEIAVDGGSIWANGGGGGGGADNGASGAPGAAATSPTSAGAGGMGGSALVGRGGSGAIGTSQGAPGTDDATGAGGGGGGGGVGALRVFGTLTSVNGSLSPPPATM